MSTEHIRLKPRQALHLCAQRADLAVAPFAAAS